MTPDKTLNEILEAIDSYRGIILDTVEQEVGLSPRWQFVRFRLLNALGNRGLRNRVHEIITGEPIRLSEGDIS